jgi:ABC-type Mn2+/Zn2+ transport system permease subunit
LNELNAFDWSLLAAPFAAGLLVLATHVPLGREVLKRGIIFIDLAIAQVAGLGVMLAKMLEWSHSEATVDTATQLTAAAAACAGCAVADLERQALARDTGGVDRSAVCLRRIRGHFAARA